MKTITKLSYAFFLCASLSLVSCSDDDGGSTGGSAEYVKAKIDGDNFSSSGMFVSATNPMEGVLMIQGSDDSGAFIQISLMNFDGEGTYDVSNQLNGYAQYGTVNPVATFNSAMGNGATGEVVITESTETHVKGTFEFTGRRTQDGTPETVEVTNGEFKAQY